jgi:hypothetical protein
MVEIVQISKEGHLLSIREVRENFVTVRNAYYSEELWKK